MCTKGDRQWDKAGSENSCPGEGLHTHLFVMPMCIYIFFYRVNNPKYDPHLIFCIAIQRIKM